jgi:heat shock protein HslJ
MGIEARLALVSAAVVLELGCAAAPATSPTDVVGMTWHLESLQRAGGLMVAPPPGSFFLRFGEEGRLDVRADCNGCGGTYSLNGDRLAVGPLACTRAFCPSAPFDTQFVQLAEAATTVERHEEALVLRSAAGMLRFVP